MSMRVTDCAGERREKKLMLSKDGDVRTQEGCCQILRDVGV